MWRPLTRSYRRTVTAIAPPRERAQQTVDRGGIDATEWALWLQNAIALTELPATNSWAREGDTGTQMSSRQNPSGLRDQPVAASSSAASIHNWLPHLRALLQFVSVYSCRITTSAFGIAVAPQVRAGL